MEEEHNHSTKHEEILTADRYAKSLLADLNSAEHSIDLETYIFEDDVFGKMVAQTLAAAATRGTKVRLLVDGIGTPSLGKNLAILENAGVQVKIFHAVPWKTWQWSRTKYFKKFAAKLYYLFAKINRRSHRKTCVIDNKIVYIGSMNITQRHLSILLEGEDWLDVNVKITGISTEHLNFAFNKAWNMRKTTLVTTKKLIDLNPTFRLNFSRHLRRALYKSLLNRIHESQERVWMMNTYFNPELFLLKELIQTAKRGVDVKIILPRQCDLRFMPLIARTFYADLLKAGVSIYEYLPHILHSKILIIDDWFCLGSSNLNHRSLKYDLEVDVTIETDAAKEKIEKTFTDALMQSRKIDPAYLKKIPFYSVVLGRMLLFVRYLL